MYEFVDGITNVLRRSLTGTEALRLLQAIGGHIERETGHSPGIAAMLQGEDAPRDVAKQFQTAVAGAANLIQTMGLARAGTATATAGAGGSDAEIVATTPESTQSLTKPADETSVPAGKMARTTWREVTDRSKIRQYVSRVRDTLDDPRLQDVIQRAAAQVPGDAAPRDKIAALLSPDIDPTVSLGGGPAGVPYLSRAPLVSMVQSHLEEALGDAEFRTGASTPACGRGSSMASSGICGSHRHRSRPTTPTGTSSSPRACSSASPRATRPSTQAPAEYDGVADDARLVIVGDWGTGLPRARDVAALMQERIADAVTGGRQVHVLHLGDVYYSGLETEDQRRFLDLWPVTPGTGRCGRDFLVA